MRSRFFADQSGGVAPIFALAIVPIVGLAGAAGDYTRAASARTAMYAALDATGLMLSRDAATLTQEQINAKATQIFNAEFNRTDVANVQVNALRNSPQAGSYTLNITASGNLPATFTRILGQNQFSLNSNADFQWGIKKLELALALDNTGSMGNSGKLTQLKTGAKNLLTPLQAAAKQPGDVKVSIIPFDTMVNVGTVYKDQFWIDYTVKNIQKDQWTGCVMDRDQSNDVSDTTPVSGSASTLFPAKQCGSLVSMMPLTDVLDTTGFTDLNAKIDSMGAAGNTNVTIGMEWGWQSLTTNLPLAQAPEPSPDRDKVVVLLTDGTNTQNRWSNSDSQIDPRTALACTNAKNANIKIYTVRVIDGDKTLLKNCASKPTMYYEVNQASELNSVFSSIAQNLARLRIDRKSVVEGKSVD